MIRILPEQKTVLLENGALRASLDYSCGLHFAELSNRSAAGKTNVWQDLFTLQVFEHTYGSDAFTCTDVSYAKDAEMELATFLLESSALCMKLRIHLIDEGKRELRLIYQLWDNYREGVPSVVFLHIPFLSALESGEAGERKYYPLNSVRDKDGADVLHRVNESFYSSDIIMPLVVCGRNGHGFSVDFPVPSDLSDLGSVQNVNYQLSRISSETELQTHQVRLNPDASFNDTVDLIISGLDGGWAEAFDACRRRWRQWYDLSEYAREDLQWFRKCPVHNFTFLYGKEAFDHENQKIDVERLVREGEEFGGFDTVILWNQYPRLGLDERTQWDFHDDFPGGRAALRKAVDELHAHGVKVLLPFIPWDRHEYEGTDSMGTELARLAADTDLDGLHLDTMKMFAHSARGKLDAVRPGIVLETQGHPMKKRSMEYITTSWNEFWSADPMPEDDLLRFMLPQHSAPVIGRWLRLQDKDKLIRRAEFGAAPIVIWQDIFGRWMPYNDAQKKRIARWKQTYLRYFDIYFGSDPIPLYDTQTENVFCNVFTDDAKTAQIYSFYNDTDRAQRVEALTLWRFTGKHASVVLGSGFAALENGALCVTVPPMETLHVLVEGV